MPIPCKCTAAATLKTSNIVASAVSAVLTTPVPVLEKVCNGPLLELVCRRRRRWVVLLHLEVVVVDGVPADPRSTSFVLHGVVPALPC